MVTSLHVILKLNLLGSLLRHFDRRDKPIVKHTAITPKNLPLGYFRWI